MGRSKLKKMGKVPIVTADANRPDLYFLPDDRVLCIDAGVQDGLANGKIYTIKGFDIGPNKIILLELKETNRSYFPERFVRVDESNAIIEYVNWKNAKPTKF